MLFCPSDPMLLRRARAAGVEIRALLITSPHNPTGRLYSPKALLAAVAWGRSRDLHIIVDEVIFGAIDQKKKTEIDEPMRPKTLIHDPPPP